MRFDYFGCGDSEGDFEEGSLAQWTSDIRSAIVEIQERCELKSICLIGLRIGATLALQAATDSLHVKSIALWEPIFDGRLYIKELVKTQEDFCHELDRKKCKQSRSEIPNEILGFPFTSKLKENLEGIALDHLESSPNIKLLALCNREESLSFTCSRDFTQSHPQTDFHVLADHVVWEEELYKRLIPFNTLQYLAKWAGAAHP